MIIFVNPNARVNENIPNLSLVYVATKLGIRVIDLNTLKAAPERFLGQPAEVLGISVQTRTLNEARRIADAYKDKFPQAQIKSIKGPIDIQCCYPFLDFDESMAIDISFGDGLPFPDYELFDSFKVFQKNWRKGLWNYAIMTSLGCPFQCTFCMSRKRKWQDRSARNCYEELRAAKEKWRIKSFEIIDDCFNVNKKRAIEFCRLVEGLGLKWLCTNGLRADLFDEELAQAMKKAGCYQANFGVESADPEVLKSIKKGETIEQIEAAVKTAKKHFKKVNGFFIIGLPGSSYEKDLASLKWAKKLGINAHFSYYAPADQVLKSDGLFYGAGAKPMAEIYPKDLQEKIYRQTQGMRPRQFLRKLKGLFIR
ncbi:B12-binding domain-containing radical SAM protein [Candidatus Margulisiibacteriota bacterium]